MNQISADDNTLRYADDLAEALGKGRTYIYAMKKEGFKMPGGTSTVVEGRAWLKDHPNFSTSGYFKKQATKGGRKKGIHLGDLPSGDLEKEILFHDGEAISACPAVGVVDQVLIDAKQVPLRDEELNMDGELSEQFRADSKAFLGEFILEKIESFDYEFFEAAAVLIKRRKESAGACDPLRMEMMLIKKQSHACGKNYNWQEVSDMLRYSSGDKKTIEKAAKEIGLSLVKRPRGRQKSK